MKGVAHLALTTDAKDFSAKLENIKKAINLQVKNSIPIMTIHLTKKNETTEEDVKKLVKFFDELRVDKVINENRVKINVFGKWYDLSPDLVDSLKKVFDETKDYDQYFLNLCLNYDGREEVMDACKLIARKVKLGKLDPELITTEMIKENIYLSSFLPPNIILKYGDNKIPCILAWDSEFAELKMMNKYFDDFDEKDFD